MGGALGALWVFLQWMIAKSTSHHFEAMVETIVGMKGGSSLAFNFTSFEVFVCLVLFMFW